MESIAEMLQSLQETEMINKLYSEWNDLLKQDDVKIDIDLRNKFDQWFLNCHKLCIEDSKYLDEANFYTVKDELKSRLYDEFMEQLRETTQFEQDFPVKLRLQHELAKLKDTSAEEWIQRACLCVKKERKLMDKYNKFCNHLEEEEKTENVVYISGKRPCELKYEEVQRKKQVLQGKLTELENIVEYYQNKLRQEDNAEYIVQGLQDIAALLPDAAGNTNGLHNKTQQQRTYAENLVADLHNSLQNFSAKAKEAFDHFETIYGDFCDLTEKMYEEVKAWQYQLKLDYVELAANVNLDSVARWCAETGQLLRDTMNTELSRLKNTMFSMTGSESSDFSYLLNSCEKLFQRFMDLLQSFFHRTFVVTEQETWCVKKDKSQIPKVTVRILAADHMPLEVLDKPKVCVCFILEDHLNQCLDENHNIIPEMLKEKSQKLKNDSVDFSKIKKTQKYEGKFTNIQLKFDRGARQKFVHEEKYRLVFYMEVHGSFIWTISLPMVVTTGANQNCQCLASIMWQCYSTDVFAVPIETKSELPWSTVAEMLKDKMRKLSDQRSLTEDNLNHLKHRILGQNDTQEEDPMITLTEFCVDKLERESLGSGDDEKCPFSFWKWFLAIYNLIEKYLKPYWDNGWIEGFISKKAAERKLMESPKCRSAMYMLRFSDSTITDSQGLKSVFGLVTAAVLMVKKAKDNLKAKTVHHLDVAGHNKLKDKPLANIMLGTEDNQHKKFYQFLYPHLKPSEPLFSQYSSSDPVVPGYKGVRDAFIVDLEQLLQKLELTGKRTSSSSSGPEDQDSYQDSKSPGLLGSKRMKRDSTDSKSSCSQTANTPLSYNASASNLTSPQPLQNTRSPSEDCPTLKNLLTQNKAQSSNPVSSQSTQSVAASPEPSGIPTVVRDSRDSWSPISQQSNDCVSTTHSYPSLTKDFSSPGNQHQSWSEQQSFTQMLQNPNFSDNQLQEFSQNPTLSGSTFQNDTVSSAFDDNSAASLYNAIENQPYYLNVGNQLDTVEPTDPSMTQLPTELADHTVIMNFILCGLPILPKDDRLKLLDILQNDCQEEKTKLTEDQQTTDDQVTSSSSGPGGFTIDQSQLQEGMESDSGSLVHNLDLFDTLENVTNF